MVSVGIWGGGREGQAAVADLLTKAPDAALVVVDENPDLTWPDLPATAQYHRGPDGLTALLGVDRVIVSPGIPAVHPFRAVLAERGIVTTSGTALWLADHWSTTIGVSGTKGKSTTAALTAALLTASGSPARLAGNIGLALLGLPDFAGTTVAELSSYQCDSIERSPKVAVITNLFEEHLTWHGSLQAYWRAKCRLFDQGAETLVADPETLDKIGRLGVGLPDQVVTPTEAVRQRIAAAVDAQPPDHLAALFGAAHGRHNLALALCAAEAAGHPVDPAGLAQVVVRFAALPHRQTLIGTVHGKTWYDDSLSTSAESAIAALETYADRPRVILVGGLSRGISYDGLNDYLLAQTEPPLVVTMPTNGREIVARYEQTRPDRVAHGASLAEAVALADALAPPRAAILLSPAAPSYDLYANHEAKSAEFVALVRRLDQAG